MKNHWILMVIGCGLTLLFIFFAPSIGIGGDVWLFTFLVLMFAIHLMMLMRHEVHTHGVSDEKLDERNEQNTKENQEKHQHKTLRYAR